MARKDDVIARLSELAVTLEREVDTSGSVADLELRLREAEDEVAALAGDADGMDGLADMTIEGDVGAAKVGAEEVVHSAIENAGDVLIDIRVLKTLTVRVAHGKGTHSKIIPMGTEVTVRTSEFEKFKSRLAVRVR